MSGSLILLDDSAFLPGFIPSSLWNTDNGHPDIQRWYQHSSTWAEYSDTSSSKYGSFSVNFEGISIAFTGNTPPSTMRQNFSVFIDDGDSYIASYPAQSAYMQWYTSPTLEEGNHTITITEMDRTDVDYALVGVSGQTTTLGKNILVDSTSDSIVWVGYWQTKTSILIPTFEDFHVVSYPLGNSTKDSSTSGNSFSFQFTGTNISVFGIQRNSINGFISADFSVDGGTNTTFSTNGSRSGNDVANTMFFSSPILPHGIHTLIMNITSVTGDQSLKLDYIAYSDQESNSNNSSSPPTSSASPSSSNMPSGSSSLSGSSTSASAPKKTNSKRVVGGVVGGGIALLLIIAGALFWWRRKRQAYQEANLMSSSQPFTYNSDHSIIRQVKTEQRFNTRRKNGGIPVAGSTSTVGPSHMAPLSPALSRRGSASENQGAIRRGLDESNGLIAQIEQPSTEMTRIQELQNRIEMLTEENARLMDVPPPAYGD
ncbi:hypothetical protein ARMGADRAFT_1085891 [Armillaria gallica]|uniref:Uncharacterized protein n=1 Tax=Armillaria gallica TaxID=47427 RepID=A0A2H3D8H4_ARMGA|nr:hypothetical protein ARMGADRAFT_1085891 [Armillaria gallica]